jgi:hypothetical protein
VWRQGFITEQQLRNLAEPLKKSGYGEYLLGLLKFSFRRLWTIVVFYDIRSKCHLIEINNLKFRFEGKIVLNTVNVIKFFVYLNV